MPLWLSISLFILVLRVVELLVWLRGFTTANLIRRKPIPPHFSLMRLKSWNQRGRTSPTIKMANSKELDKLAKNLFGKSEVKNRIGLNAAKMITGDIVTLYQEFRKASGAGALCFNPTKPDKSIYMTVSDLKVDMALAEEMCDSETAAFLAKAIELVHKVSADEDKALVLLTSNYGISAHVVDLEQANSRLDGIADAASRD